MYAVGMPLSGDLYFMYATILIAVPTGVKIFNWLATMWRSSMTFETPMMWALGTMLMFTIGGLTGLMQGVAPTDVQYHDTYFIVGHFHYTLMSGVIFALYTAAYYWLPKMTGHMVDEKLGKLHFWISVVSMNFVFMPQIFAGISGMPRRIPDYPLQFTEWNVIATIGAMVLGISQILFVIVLIKNIRGGKPAGDNPWNNKGGLEWTVPSPAPFHHTFPFENKK